MYLALFFISMVAVAFVIDYVLNRQINKGLREMSSTREGLRVITEQIDELSQELERQQAKLELFSLDDTLIDRRPSVLLASVAVNKAYLNYRDTKIDLGVNLGSALITLDYTHSYCHPKSKEKADSFGAQYPRLALCS